MKILLADDDKISRVLLKRILLSVPGREITEAENGQAAWDILRTGSLPDLCITDNKMPGLSGLELLEKIRNEPRLADLRVMMCTYSSDRGCVTKAAKLRVDYYILKPFQAELLLKQVEKVNQETVAKQTLENPAQVCRRLGITPEIHRELLASLLEELPESYSNICQSLVGGAAPAALIQINGLKGACANLGANRLVAGLSKLETVLQEMAVPLSSESGGGARALPNGCFGNVPLALTMIDDLRNERARLGQAVAALNQVEPATTPETAQVLAG